jgi:SAM-dependent methyltransferase
LLPSWERIGREIEGYIMSEKSIKEIVREKYGQIASGVVNDATTSCCGSGASSSCCDPISSDLYDIQQQSNLPADAVAASLGCGNPTALAELAQGEVVLDLGSGGGIDVLLSAKRVGPSGKAYGLDMTDEMLSLARKNAVEAGVDNVEFLKGEMEAIPLPDNSVDVIISNCVINLSADKRTTLAEAFRVLKPGGRFAVSDIVVRGEVDAAIRRSVELWVGCVAGALEEKEFESILTDVGFEDVDIEPTRIYRAKDAKTFLGDACCDSELASVGPEMDGKFMSAFVRGRKPFS